MSIVNILLIAITCAVSFTAFRNRKLIDTLILEPPRVARGHEYWRLVTHGFIHADGQHLLFNMITLFFFGRIMEQAFEPYIGPVGYALFYLSAIPVAILPTYLRHRTDPRYRCLGASGAVSAVLFAFILIDPWSMILVFFLPLPAILYAVIYVGYTIWAERARRDNINHSAHLFGAAYGVLFTIALEPRVVLAFLEKLAQPRFGI